MADLGKHDLDLPFLADPDGPTVNLRAQVSGGMVVAACRIDVGDEGKPALLFRFSDPQGEFYKPTLLVLDTDQAEKVVALVTDAVASAMKAVGGPT